MSECKHKILHLTSGGFYCAYVDCDLELREPKDFIALLNRIKALEGVVEAAKDHIEYVHQTSGGKTTIEQVRRGADFFEKLEKAVKEAEEV